MQFEVISRTYAKLSKSYRKKHYQEIARMQAFILRLYFRKKEVYMYIYEIVKIIFDIYFLYNIFVMIHILLYMLILSKLL